MDFTIIAIPMLLLAAIIGKAQVCYGMDIYSYSSMYQQITPPHFYISHIA